MAKLVHGALCGQVGSFPSCSAPATWETPATSAPLEKAMEVPGTGQVRAVTPVR